MPDAAEAPFLDAVLRTPDADGPRLVFADWLDERGDVRGRFIRVQCALARLPAEDPRRLELLQHEDTILERFYAEWTEPFRGLASGLDFRRGFVESVIVESRTFLARAPDLFRLAPVRHARFLDVGSSLEELADSPWLARLAGLTCYAQHLGDDLARAVAGSPHLSGLTRLELARNRITDVGVLALAVSPTLRGLTHLDLSDNALGDRAAVTLAGGAWPALSRLELHTNGVGIHGLTALLGRAGGELRHLGMRDNRTGAATSLSGVRFAPAGGPRLLDLRRNDLHGQSAILDLFDDGRAFRETETLDLGENQLGDAGVERLAAARGLTGVRCLYLNDNHIGDIGVLALGRSAALSRLNTLDLSHNPVVRDLGMGPFLTARLPSLARLGLPGMGVSAPLRRALQDRYEVPRRRH